MVNPGAFQGLRKDFLMGEKQAYAVAVKEGYVGDVLASIYRRYLKRFPIDLDHKEDPTPEFLAAVDNNSVDAEPAEPDPTAMSPEEYEAAIKKQQEHSKLLQFRQAQIKRWLAYQYSKDNHTDSKEAGHYNPYNIMIHQLTGKSSTYPRARSAANVWRKFHRDAIEQKLKVEIVIALRAGKPILKDHYAAEQDKIARDMFSKLPFHVQKHWKEQSVLEHQEAVRQYEHEISEPPSTEPADCQRAIQNLATFIQPVLDLVSQATGWKSTLIAGGPEPAHDGRLNIISVHSGTTRGDIKMNFGRCEHVAYKSSIVSVFGNFLQKCYSPEECRAQALPHDMGFMPMSSLEVNEEEFSIHSVIMDNANTVAEATDTPGQPSLSPTTSSQHCAVDPSDNSPTTSCSNPNRDSEPEALGTGRALPPRLDNDTNTQRSDNSPMPSPPISRSATPIPLTPSPSEELEQEDDNNPFAASFTLPDSPAPGLVPTTEPASPTSVEPSMVPLPPLSSLPTTTSATRPPKVARKRMAALAPEAPAQAPSNIADGPPSRKRKANAGVVDPALLESEPKRIKTRSITKAAKADTIQATATGKARKGKKSTKVNENIHSKDETAKRPVRPARNKKVVRH